MVPLRGFGGDGAWFGCNRKGSSNVAQQNPRKTKLARAKSREKRPYKVPINWRRFRDSVTDNFRVIDSKDFRVIA
jgi:hypothetical protein